MKKLLVLLLALAVLLSLSGVAFAGPSFSWKSGSMINGDIYKSILFKNEAKTSTGDATAMANGSMTCVDSMAEAKAIDDSAMADNASSRLVSNTGTADAVSAPADALNEANNSEEETITEQAETHADCSMFMEKTTCCDACCEVQGAHLRIDSNNNHACDMCGCECCPASVIGDIKICVEYQNKADAKTGDATATGNVSATSVSAYSKAIASNGGTASNTDDTSVINDGTATAMSGTAMSTNLVNNSVKIDIFRGAMSTKTVDVVMDFLSR